MEENKKVCIFTQYSDKGASSKYRILLYKEKLDESFNTKYYHFWNDRYVTKYMGNKMKYLIPISLLYIYSSISRVWQIFHVASKCDVVVFQKAIIPAINITFIPFLKRKGIKVIFDVDDAIYLKKIDYSEVIASKSDRVIVGNERLKDHYMKFCNDISLIPTVDYSPAYKPFQEDTSNEKCIGWIGSQATIDNLDLMIEPINQIVQRHPEVRFEYICNDSFGYTNKIQNSKFIPWDSSNYIENMSKFTIGIMPLKNTEFNKGKCGFKLIQYLNLLKPVIASDVGVNAELVSNYGHIVNTTDEWVEALESLLFDERTYRDCVNNIEDSFDDKYSYKAISSRLIEVIDR